MLILTRRPNEVIKIGDNIEIKLLWVKGNQIALGITAPDDVNILREEVAKRNEFKKLYQEYGEDFGNRIEYGSTNVWMDLGFKDAEERLNRAEERLNKTIRGY